MNGEQRREKILHVLKKSNEAVNATALADMVGVTRQVIVSDIALLRASGVPVRAEHRGYVLDVQRGIFKSIVCRHGKESVRDEFYAVVDNGGAVLDVQVEHPIYGQISAAINVSSRYDADSFIKATSESGASQLSELTDGVHIHTLRVPSSYAFDRICNKLKELGILITD